jgi:hypothetical protein
MNGTDAGRSGPLVDVIRRLTQHGRYELGNQMSYERKIGDNPSRSIFERKGKVRKVPAAGPVS